MDKYGFKAGSGKWVQGTEGYKSLSRYAWKTVVMLMHKILDKIQKEIESKPRDLFEEETEEEAGLKAREIDVRKSWERLNKKA